MANPIYEDLEKRTQAGTPSLDISGMSPEEIKKLLLHPPTVAGTTRSPTNLTATGIQYVGGGESPQGNVYTPDTTAQPSTAMAQPKPSGGSGFNMEALIAKADFAQKMNVSPESVQVDPRTNRFYVGKEGESSPMAGGYRVDTPSGGRAYVEAETSDRLKTQWELEERRKRLDAEYGGAIVQGPGEPSGGDLAALFPKTYAAQQEAAATPAFRGRTAFGAKDSRFDDPDMSPYKKEIQKLEKLAGSMHKSGASRRQATARLKEINADVTSRRATREAKELREANVKIAKAQVEMDRAATFDKAQKAWAKGRNLDDASVTKMNREIRNVLRGNDEVEQLFAMAKSADQSDELMSGIHDIVFGEQYDPETLGEFITTFVAGNILK
jgi:hypothetical protein